MTTAAEAREMEEAAARTAAMRPVARRMAAIREQLALLDRALGELRDGLEPVLLQGPVPVTAGRVEQVVNASTMGDDLDGLAAHLESVVERVRALTSQVDL